MLGVDEFEQIMVHHRPSSNLLTDATIIPDFYNPFAANYGKCPKIKFYKN